MRARIPGRSNNLRDDFTTPAVACVARIFALALLFALPARGQVVSFEGRTVAEIRVVDELGNPVPQRIPPLTLAVGKPFDFPAERESLRSLYRTGDYSDIRVTATDQPAGVRVDFIVRRNFYYNEIRIEGLKPPPTESAARAALRLPLGEPFRESEVSDAIGRLESALHDDGFYTAKIARTLEPHEDTRQMNIAIGVSPGPRAAVGDINVQNQTSYPDKEMVRRSKISRGKPMTAGRLSRGAQNLRMYLVDQGYLGAGAIITPGTYDPASNRVPLDMSVTAGPRMRLEITGAHLSKTKRRKLLPIYAEGAVDEDLLQEGRRNIRDYFQSQGYFNADVEVTSRQDDSAGQRVIGYEISRGDRFRVAGVAFEGNKYFRNELLSRRLLLQPASFASKGRFSQQLMRADADSIRTLYLSNGFRDAQVSSSVDDQYEGKKNNLFVTFHIVEGAQTLISDLRIEGNQAIPLSSLLNVTGSTAGEPYSEVDVASDRNNILALYYNEGFPQAAFQEEVIPGSRPNGVRLVYHITEGTRVDVSQVLLTGYEHTREGIISRQVEIKPEGPLREGDVAKTQRQLYDLGVFDRVQIASQNPAGTDPDKTVVVEAHEGQRYTIGYGVGLEVQRIAGGSTSPNGSIIGASPRGIFEIARANMFGRAQTLSFKARASTLEYRVALGYTASNFANQRNLDLQLTGFADKTQDINTFTSTRFEGGLQLAQKLTPSSSILYRYFYRRVKASDLRIAADEIPLLSQPTLVSGFGITYARDRRDDPGDPTHGNFNTVDASYAARTLGSGADFFRGFFQNSSFHPFGRAFVFARSVRFGVEETTGTTEELDVPLPERFFAGGGTSLRGFGLNQAGPRDPVTGFPIGGLALLVFNQELRFPMRLPFVGERLGGTIFYDGGNVYSDIDHISFAYKPPSLTNLDYFSHTVGFGLRYPTPIGPVRVDFGYQLNPASYQATVTPANTMTPVTETLTLPHFGFSFNIGPVF